MFMYRHGIVIPRKDNFYDLGILGAVVFYYPSKFNGKGLLQLIVGLQGYEESCAILLCYRLKRVYKRPEEPL
jgi:hypothetical protein